MWGRGNTYAAALDDPLAEVELARLDAYWRAANYLTVGQIYLLENALLDRPLCVSDVKPRSLGHWGTSPGLNILYAHLSRVIARDGLDMIYVIGPGHGGPAILANTWLEGSYTDTYPAITRDREGMDPGLVLWLIEAGGLTAEEVRDGLEQRSGLAGLAGTADMREILEGRARGDTACTLAFDVYAHRLRRELGGMRAASTGSTSVSSPAVSGSTRPLCAPRAGSSSIRWRTPGSPETVRSVRRARRCARSSSPPAKTSRSRGWFGRSWRSSAAAGMIR